MYKAKEVPWVRLIVKMDGRRTPERVLTEIWKANPKRPSKEDIERLLLKLREEC